MNASSHPAKPWSAVITGICSVEDASRPTLHAVATCRHARFNSGAAVTAAMYQIEQMRARHLPANRGDGSGLSEKNGDDPFVHIRHDPKPSPIRGAPPGRRQDVRATSAV